MNEPTKYQKLGATPAKLALVAVLGIVLLAVVVPQLGGGHSTVSETTKVKPRKKLPNRVAAKTEAPKKQTTPEIRPVQNWPELSLKQATKFDPLASPAWYVVEQEEDNHQLARTAENIKAIQELEKQGTKIIVISNRERTATIGDQQVKIGDMIEGFRVSDITTQGVVLTELLSK